MDFFGVQVIDLMSGLMRSTLSWQYATRSDSTIQAIRSGRELVFVSFECSGRRNSNTIMVYDSNSLSTVEKIYNGGAKMCVGIAMSGLRVLQC